MELKTLNKHIEEMKENERNERREQFLKLIDDFNTMSNNQDIEFSRMLEACSPAEDDFIYIDPQTKKVQPIPAAPLGILQYVV